MSLKKLDTVGHPGAAYKVERMEGRISACGKATEMIIVLKVAFTHKMLFKKMPGFEQPFCH